MRARLSQGDIARALGVSPVSVCQWETGRSEPRGDRARLYLQLLRRLQKEVGE